MTFLHEAAPRGVPGQNNSITPNHPQVSPTDSPPLLQVKIWFQNRRMKLKKELRAVKEINEQVRREREEQEKLKQQQDDKKNNKEQPSAGNTPAGAATNASSSSSSTSSASAGGGAGDTKAAT